MATKGAFICLFSIVPFLQSANLIIYTISSLFSLHVEPAPHLLSGFTARCWHVPATEGLPSLLKNWALRPAPSQRD